VIGTSNASQPQDIVIKGAGIQDHHAYIINQDDVVTLYPLSEQTSVDGVRITKPTRMSQGEKITIICCGLQFSRDYVEGYVPSCQSCQVQAITD
jgi:FHA domain